ncbi:hypothetical protein U8335_01305 [Roseiconus lacunae]|uniref:hypothetical protein n=1 Tax=Roseiconus lacunae TaxID=2605694 RepID=UPI00308C9013|nr:hypothetical protein U8335_01305 [Stieleria sp. HD01]
MRSAFQQLAPRRRTFLAVVRLFLAASLSGWSMTPGAHAWEPSDDVIRGNASLELRLNALKESSGLAFSLREPNCVWTHNDSGGQARLFAFDDQGRSCGRVIVKGIKANDWEDIASFDDDGPRLLIADVGDNDHQRSSVSLYLLDEPNPQTHSRITPYVHLVVRYANGAQNCESVAVDVKNRRIWLLSKSGLVASLHELELPKRESITPAADDAGEAVPTIEVTTTLVRRVPVPLATGMDFCPRTGDLWICSYLNAFHVKTDAGRDLPTRFSKTPALVNLPKLKQIEAVAVDRSGRVWVSSEGFPTQMHRVK